MENGREGPLPHLLLKDRNHVVIRRAGMDHQRQAGDTRRCDLQAERAACWSRGDLS